MTAGLARVLRAVLAGLSRRDSQWEGPIWHGAPDAAHLVGVAAMFSHDGARSERFGPWLRTSLPPDWGRTRR